MPLRPQMNPPVGKSGPGTISISSSVVMSGFLMRAIVASMIPLRWWGGSLVAVLRVKDATVDGLEAVARVGQRARDDDAHGVIHERRLHLLLDRDRDAVAAGRRRGRGYCCGAVGAHGSDPLGLRMVSSWSWCR